MKLFKKLCFLFAFSLIISGSATHCVYGEEASVNIVSLIPRPYSQVGDIFYEGEEVLLETELRNARDIDYVVSLTATVSDTTGQTVWTSNEEITLKAKSRMVKGIKPMPEKEYGSFEVTVRISGNFGTRERLGSYTKVVTPKQKNMGIGYATHFGYPIDDIHKLLPAVKNSGAGIIRDGIKWSEVEKTKGQYEIPAYYDEYINTLIANGLTVVVQLGFHNEAMDGTGGLLLYESDNGFPNDETSRKAYAEYVKFVVDHFKDKIEIFEIWNEPNAGHYLEMTDDRTPQDYVQLLKAGYEAVKNANPDATVLGGVVTSPKNPATRNWIEDFFDNGGGAYLDSFCVHPYRDTGYYMDENEKEFQSDWSYNAWNFDDMISFVKDCMTDAGVGNKKIVITEVGTSSSTITGEDFGNYTEQEQAISLVRIAAMSQANADVDYTCFYNLRERSGSTYSIAYGTIDYGHNGKPAYAAVSNYNKQIAGTEYVDKVTDGSNFTAYQFKSDGEKQVYVLWANARNAKTAKVTYHKEDAAKEAILSYTGTDLSVTVPQARTVELFDLYGNQIEYSENSTYTFDGSPVYLVCKTENVPEIVREGDFLHVSGKGKNSGEMITLLVKKRGTLKEEIVYVNQQTIEADFNYDFNFYAEDTALYEILIYSGGEINAISQSINDYEIDIVYYIGEKLITDASELKSGDTVKAVMTITKKNTSPNLMFVGAVYGTGETLLSADVQHIEWNDGNTVTKEVELSVDELSEDIKMMLWTDALTPVMEYLDLK